MYTHGFLGYRARNTSDHHLFLDPNLPPQLAGGLTIRGVHHGDSVLDIELGDPSTTVRHRNGTQPVIVESSNGTQTVAVGQSIQLTTRTVAMLGANKDNNLALCATIDDGSEKNATDVTSSSELALTMQQLHAGTNLASGANDGSNATYFQPADANRSASLVIDLGQSRMLRTIHLNFGALPPQFVSISIAEQKSNSTGTNATSTFRSLVDRMAVKITAPYNGQDPALVAATVRLPDAWNTTDIDLTNVGGGGNGTRNDSTVQARYVNLTIEGVATPQEQGYGATLVEVQVS